VVEKWKELGDSSLAISSICEAELHYGLAKKNSSRLWTEYHNYLEDRLVLLPLDKKVSERFGALKSLMEAKGEPRADFDLLISATALVHNLTLVTLNLRHFEGIPELKLEVW
jgi:tRNA(fMet)-specific endonuclease VapC